MKKTSFEIQQKVFEMYQSGMSSEQIGKEFNMYGSVVLNLVRRSGGKIRTQSQAQRKHSLNENAFDKITEQSAYWIGFLMADGNIFIRSKSSAMISIGLSLSDFKHLEKFRDFLQASNKISIDKNRNSASFRIHSLKIAQSLSKYGVVPNKSGDAKCQRLQKNKDFWRGVIDGDGHLSIVKNRKWEYPKLDLVGSEELMKQFSTYIYKITGKQAKVSKHKSIWRVSYMGKIVVQIVSHFYLNSTEYLERKFVSARNILSLGLSHQD